MAATRKKKSPKRKSTRTRKATTTRSKVKRRRTPKAKTTQKAQKPVVLTARQLFEKHLRPLVETGSSMRLPMRSGNGRKGRVTFRVPSIKNPISPFIQEVRGATRHALVQFRTNNKVRSLFLRTLHSRFVPRSLQQHPILNYPCQVFERLEAALV